MRSIMQVATFLGLVAGQVVAQNAVGVQKEYNGETMLNLCKGTVPDVPPDVQSMTCTFRLQGVSDLMNYNCVSQREGFDPAPRLSAAISGSRGAVRQTFINYMEDHPEIWGVHWSWAVAVVMSESFACEN